MSETVKEFVLRVPRETLYQWLRSHELTIRSGQITSNMSFLGLKPVYPIIVEDIPVSRIVYEYDLGVIIRIELNFRETTEGTIVSLRSQSGLLGGLSGNQEVVFETIQALLGFEAGYLAAKA